MTGAHAKIVESIIAGRAAQAAERMQRQLTAEAAYMAEHLPNRPRLGAVFSTSSDDRKLAEKVTRKMFAETAAAGWQVGTSLGSEAELMERYGISRAILREAVRMLEHHGIAVMRRGPGGGLFVAEPGVDAAAASAAFYLDRRGVAGSNLFELRAIVEMAVLDKVIEGLTGEGAERLRDVHELERETGTQAFPVVGHDLHVVLAELSGNRVLSLITDVLVRLSRGRGARPDDADASPLPTGEVVHTHERIIEAIIAKDAHLARHRMSRHLTALAKWVR